MDNPQRKLMQVVIDDFIKPHYDRKFRVLDVGSRSVNGCHRPQFEDLCSEYIGLDITTGENVDFIPNDIYNWDELEDHSFDVIISGSCFEHVEFPWLTMQQIAKKLTKDGIVCVIAPSAGPRHMAPNDYFRYFEGGLAALAKWAGLNVIHTRRQYKKPPWRHSCVIASHLSEL